MAKGVTNVVTARATMIHAGKHTAQQHMPVNTRGGCVVFHRKIGSGRVVVVVSCVHWIVRWGPRGTKVYHEGNQSASAFFYIELYSEVLSVVYMLIVRNF